MDTFWHYYCIMPCKTTTKTTIINFYLKKMLNWPLNGKNFDFLSRASLN